VIFGLCAMLFHFANAPLLPLVGQKLALSYPTWATAMMSSCIIAAQLIMLPVRAVLYTLSDDAAWLIGVQLLDGVGAGIFGAVATVQGIGASLSGPVAGMIVDHFGYSAVFLTSGAVACAALATLFLAMPETATGRSGDALAAQAGADG
jgi:hypothetical protein